MWPVKSSRRSGLKSHFGSFYLTLDRLPEILFSSSISGVTFSIAGLPSWSNKITLTMTYEKLYYTTHMSILLTYTGSCKRPAMALLTHNNKFYNSHRITSILETSIPFTFLKTSLVNSSLYHKTESLASEQHRPMGKQIQLKKGPDTSKNQPALATVPLIRKDDAREQNGNLCLESICSQWLFLAQHRWDNRQPSAWLSCKPDLTQPWPHQELRERSYKLMLVGKEMSEKVGLHYPWGI